MILNIIRGRFFKHTKHFKYSKVRTDWTLPQCCNQQNRLRDCASLTVCIGNSVLSLLVTCPRRGPVRSGRLWEAALP